MEMEGDAIAHGMSEAASPAPFALAGGRWPCSGREGNACALKMPPERRLDKEMMTDSSPLDVHAAHVSRGRKESHAEGA
ncbi:MAG TPA: hypothetical protein VF092_23255, partial [Longimicrobium sp.]